MNVLIALLGQTPGVVTAAYYALARDSGVALDRVVTISTRGAASAEDYVRQEFERWRREGGTVDYTGIPTELPSYDGKPQEYRRAILPLLQQATCLRIPYDDVNGQAEIDCFREVLRALLVDVYRDHELHVSVAGGRKSMAAIATLAAQLYGYSVNGLYHVYIASRISHPTIEGAWLFPEEQGVIGPGGLGSLDPIERERLLRPRSDEVSLVPISFFRIDTQAGQPRLQLRGEMQEYLLEYLADNESLLQLAALDTNRDVMAYMFEEKVADHLRSTGEWETVTPRALKDWFKGKGKDRPDFDVWAETHHRVLICECKHQDKPGGLVEARKFEQAALRLKAARQVYEGEKQVSAWVVSNSNQAEDGAWKYVLDPDNPVEFRQVKFKRAALQKLETGEWLASLREPWLEGDFEIVPVPDYIIEQHSDSGQ